ncbi:protein CREG2 [Cololabis saira]|uniref:protein CREG2 n=1 Tax=Cololabis saira TaxID=129043 RepID=UPI002AD29804|nr:protein CREG2 [Cololabis saira]
MRSWSGTVLPALPALLVLLAAYTAPCRGHSLRGSVSWGSSVSSVSSSSADPQDADLSDLSAEAAPALLEAGWWRSSGPASSAEPRSPQGKPGVGGDESPRSSRLFSYRDPPPPPHQDTARTARYISHYSDWGHLATISTQDKIRGLPFGNIFSVSDGPLGNSTGVVYFYVTPMDNTVADLSSNPLASLTFSEAEGDFCRQMVYEAEDPRCARLTLTGKMVAVPPEELAFAKEAMFSRHPVMAKWPVGHKWFFMRLDLIQVWLQDWVGGVSLVPLEDYFKASPF